MPTENPISATTAGQNMRHNFGKPNGASVVMAVDTANQRISFIINENEKAGNQHRMPYAPAETAQQIQAYTIDAGEVKVRTSAASTADSVSAHFNFSSSAGKIPEAELVRAGNKMLEKLSSSLPPSVLPEVTTHLNTHLPLPVKIADDVSNKIDDAVEQKAAATSHTPHISVEAHKPSAFQQLLTASKKLLAPVKKAGTFVSALVAVPASAAVAIQEGMRDGPEAGLKAGVKDYIDRQAPWINEPDACKQIGEGVGYVTGGISALGVAIPIGGAAAITSAPTGGASIAVAAVKGTVATIAAYGVGHEVGALATEGVCNLARGATQNVANQVKHAPTAETVGSNKTPDQMRAAQTQKSAQMTKG